jgi:hypothetical protein
MVLTWAYELTRLVLDPSELQPELQPLASGGCGQGGAARGGGAGTGDYRGPGAIVAGAVGWSSWWVTIAGAMRRRCAVHADGSVPHACCTPWVPCVVVNMRGGSADPPARASPRSCAPADVGLWGGESSLSQSKSCTSASWTGPCLTVRSCWEPDQTCGGDHGAQQDRIAIREPMPQASCADARGPADDHLARSPAVSLAARGRLRPPVRTFASSHPSIRICELIRVAAEPPIMADHET